MNIDKKFLKKNTFLVGWMTQYMFIKACIYIGDDTHMTSIKIVQFSRPPIPQSVYVQNSSTPRPEASNFKRPPTPDPPPLSKW